MLSGNTETGITVTYQDSDGTIDFVVASQTDENFTTTLKNKLDAIEAGADVTDATNVNSAGAVMNSDTSTASMNFVVDEDNFASNSATKVPTQQSVKAYVDANAGGGISNLVEDTSPQLGGDLVTNSHNISLDDDHKVNFGNSSDLQIFHTGTNTYVRNLTGELYLQTNDAAGNYNNGVTIKPNGAVELYHDNIKKFETSSGGATLTGNFLPEANNTRNLGSDTLGWNSIWASTRFRGNDNVKLILGSGQDLQIYHDGSHNYIYSDNGELKNRAAIWKVVNKANSEIQIKATENAGVELYYDNSKKFETTSAGATVTGALTATGDVTAFSDETLKKDITTIENAIDICSKLRGVSYKWIKDDKASIGVIAQEVEKVIPEVVHTTEHEGAEVKSVDYGKIIGVLINAINEQQAKWDEWMELLKEIRKMENKLIEVIGNY